jgi:hypothetical protein
MGVRIEFGFLSPVSKRMERLRIRTVATLWWCLSHYQNAINPSLERRTR